MAGSTSGGAAEATTRTRTNLRATVGWSVGIATPIETRAYLRVGLGYAAETGTPPGGIAVDAGATGDYRIGRDVTLGLQVGYQGFAPFTGRSGARGAPSMEPR